jgi:hypothetical protein
MQQLCHRTKTAQSALGMVGKMLRQKKIRIIMVHAEDGVP